MKLNLGSGRYPLDGFENLNEPGSEWTTDPLLAWRAEDGLAAYGDNSIEAVTISHLLMYLTVPVIADLLKEVYRVLLPGSVLTEDGRFAFGVLRVTEDETGGPSTRRPGIQPGATTATTPGLLVGLLDHAGFAPFVQHSNETLYRDDSLIQQWHGYQPDVFHVEGVKC